jgi:tryptophan synthase alpha chain
MSLENNRLVAAFDRLHDAGEKTLLPFITAGHPDLETTLALLGEFERRGVQVCELGIPFSDPIADGPTIQASYTEALAGGVRPGKIFEMVRRYRSEGGAMALLGMVTFSIVYRLGVREFIQRAAEAGLDGLIIPDMSLEEADNLSELCDEAGLATVLLVAPTSSPERRRRIASYCTGFVYYVSVAGTTGERTELPESTIQAVRELRAQANKPVCVGFGISSAELVGTVCRVADGAIVGSAIVRRVTENVDAGRDVLVQRVGDFVAELLSGAR